MLLKRLIIGILWLILITSSQACPTKDKVLDCFYARADVNHDGYITTRELKKSIYARLPWWKRFAFKLFGGISTVLDDCDFNHDGTLTKEEAKQMPKTCLETCYKRDQTNDLFNC